MSECGNVKGAFSTQDVNIGWYGYEVIRKNRLRVGPAEHFDAIQVVDVTKRVGVQSTRNPKGVDNPPRRPLHKDAHGKQWAWVYVRETGNQGWMKASCLKERKDSVPWAHGPSRSDFHIGLEPCKIGPRSSCHGVRKNRVRIINAREVFLRYAPHSTPYRYLQKGDSVRELFRRTANDYVAVSVVKSETAPVGSRGWVSVKSLQGEHVTGIDVSNFQGKPDFLKVKGSGEEFVIAKATEGIDFIDPTFLNNIVSARRALLHVGAYHFLRPRPGRSGTREAEHFLRLLRQAKLDKGDIRPVVDVETTQLGRAETEIYVGQFVGGLRLAGFDAILYTFPGFMHWQHTFGTDLWIANFGVRQPTLPTNLEGGLAWPSYAMWQWTSKGSVPGVKGNVDRDKCPDLSRIIQH